MEEKKGRGFPKGHTIFHDWHEESFVPGWPKHGENQLWKKAISRSQNLMTFFDHPSNSGSLSTC
jgi:hypothetical protein